MIDDINQAIRDMRVAVLLETKFLSNVWRHRHNGTSFGVRRVSQ